MQRREETGRGLSLGGEQGLKDKTKSIFLGRKNLSLELQILKDQHPRPLTREVLFYRRQKGNRLCYRLCDLSEAGNTRNGLAYTGLETFRGCRGGGSCGWSPVRDRGGEHLHQDEEGRWRDCADNQQHEPSHTCSSGDISKSLLGTPRSPASPVGWPSWFGFLGFFFLHKPLTSGYNLQ